MSPRAIIAITIGLPLLLLALARADRLLYTDNAGVAREIPLTADVRRTLGLPDAGPATEPSTPPVRPPTRLTMLQAPARQQRGDGPTFQRQPAPVLRDRMVVAFSQNIVVQHSGDALVENVRSLYAWHDPATPQNDMRFTGNGMFADDNQTLVIRGYVAIDNGWQEDKPAHQKNAFRHGLYLAWYAARKGPVILEDPIFWENSANGIEVKNLKGALLRRPIFVDNAGGCLVLNGPVTIEDGIWLGGSHYFDHHDDRKGDTWTGNYAISTYGPVTLTGSNWFCGAPGQAGNVIPGKLVEYDVGCLLSTRRGGYGGNGPDDLPGWRNPGGSITVQGDCRIYGWPGVAFAGDAPMDQANRDKVKLFPGRTVSLDLSGYRKRLLDPDTDSVAIAREMRAAIRTAANP